MISLNAQAALTTLLSLMALPGALMTAVGSYLWYDGVKNHLQNRGRLGKMLVMFGLILLAIVIILTLYLTVLGEGSQASG